MRLALTAMLCGSVLLPSNAFSQMSMISSGGIGEAVSGFFGGDKATRVEQFAQIAIAKEQLESLFQAVEALKLGNELMMIFEQMFRIQAIVENVMNYEVPEDLVQEYDLIGPREHANLVDARNQYVREIDAEIAMLEKEIALDENQFATLTMATGLIAEPRSGIIAEQARFVSEQSAAEFDRRKAAIEILKAKREEIKEQISAANRISQKAARKCIREKKKVSECK